MVQLLVRTWTVQLHFEYILYLFVHMLFCGWSSVPRGGWTIVLCAFVGLVAVVLSSCSRNANDGR